MAKKVTTPAPKPAPQNRSALTAAQKTAAQAIAAIAKAAGIKATVEGAEATEPAAAVVATPVDGGNLYTDGELAQGSEVFTDEALTVAAEDGAYDAEDGREITVAGGVVESIAEASEDTDEPETTTTTEVITAAITAALAPLTARLDAMDKSVTAFSKAVPAAPRPKAAVDMGNVKGAGPKAKGLLKGASTQK